MTKWADYLISEVSYDHENLIDIAIRHQDTAHGIAVGKPVDRLTIASDIKNGLFYLTIYSGKNSWKKGHQIRSFSILGNPYLRIDGNKVAFDYLGDIPEHLIIKSELPQESEIKSESTVEPLSSPRGSLPKESTEELPQELDLAPESTVEQTEEATPEQLLQLNDLQQQIDELENMLVNQNLQELKSDKNTSEEATPEQLLQLNDLQQQIDELENILAIQLNTSDEPTPKQLSRVKELEKEIEKLEAIDIEHEIIQTLQKQNKKLEDIEHKLHNPRKNKKISFESHASDVYCVKCKTKRTIKNPEESIMKNGRPAIRGICPVCNSKVFRIVKMKK
ncbi:DUF5679 domain-containing protein [Nitrosopumilus sp.]|uniref:DUF5679 domain-containing protein n=1 Tax=Nitrosopumilus sp. TaxID=2024843 RepID=UPI00349FED8F